MYPGGEFTEDYRNEVAGKYDITIEFLEEDRNRLNSMWAAGTPPDIYRPNAIDSGNEVMRNRLLALDPYITASTIVKWDDLMDCIKQHHLLPAFKNTVKFALVAVPLGMVLQIGLAALVNAGVKGKGIFRTLYYIPSIIPVVAAVIRKYLLTEEEATK